MGMILGAGAPRPTGISAGLVRRLAVPAALIAGWGLTAAHAAPPDDEAERVARWKDLQHAIFADRQIRDGAGWISMRRRAHLMRPWCRSH